MFKIGLQLAILGLHLLKGGGVVLLFSNDSGNVEFEHFNKLAEKFGIQFNYDSKNRVTDEEFEMGTIKVPADNKILKTAKQIYIKEYSSLTVKMPAVTELQDGDNKVIAVAKVGKGTVFAVGDPWFYNEYDDAEKYRCIWKTTRYLKTL